MPFLELPIPHPLSERSPSQTNFVIEEDGSEYDGETGENKDNSSNSSSNLLHRPFWVKTIIGSLCIVSIALTIALTVVVMLYLKTFAPYETCRTKDCTRTANLFIKTMDDTIDPCEDFHKFACGNWITDTATVVSVATYDHTTIMRDRILGRLRGLVENISMSDMDALHQLKYMYNSCIDLESIEKAGLKPMVTLISRVIHTNVSVAKTLGRIRRETGQSYIFDLSISADYMNTSYNSIFIDQPDLPVGKESFSGSDDSIVQSYEYLITNVVNLLSKQFGDSVPILKDMSDDVKTIVNHESYFALAMTDTVERSKPKLNNVMTIRQLNLLFSGEDEFGVQPDNATQSFNIAESRFKRDVKSLPHVHFNWTEYFEVVFDGIISIDENTTVIVNDLGYIHALAKILHQTNRHDLDMYLAWQLMFTLGKDVTSELRTLFNRFSGQLDGNEATPNRRTECVSLLDNTVPFLLTYKYVVKYVNHSIIDEAGEMAENIIKAFKSMVSKLDWMDENTKSRAIFKADHVRKFLGYPSWLTDPVAVQQYYSGLKFTNYFFTNMLRLLKWTAEKNLRTVGQPVDHTWSSSGDSPAEADAFYDDELNAITFPAGFLQEPFIGMGLRAIDYGALGSVVGHELTHGFDTEGRYSDENGRLSSWWSVETLQRFVQKASCFIDQYNNYRLPELAPQLGDNNTVNGRLTITENIADNGGIREALQAYRYYVQDRGSPEPRLPGLEKYSPEQLFFMAFAQSWCSYMNPSSLLDMIQTNVHSPSRFRIIGPLSNFDEFSKIWQCPVGSTMNPPKKCVLW